MHARRRSKSKPTPDWLRPLLSYVRWSEWDLLSILAGLPPTSVGAGKTRQQQHDEAAPSRRDAVRRHVDDATEDGELLVERRLRRSELDEIRIEDPVRLRQLRDMVYCHTAYGERYKVKPVVAIQWALSRRKLFPDCPLTEEHLAIAQASQQAEPATGTPEAAVVKYAPRNDNVPKAEHSADGQRRKERAAVVQREMDHRGLGKTKLGLDPKTLHKVLEAEVVLETSLVKLAKGLGVPRDQLL